MFITFDLSSMETSIELMRMTGNEFLKICNLVKEDLSREALQGIFEVSHGTLHNYLKLKEKPIPVEIEEKIDKHPILRDAKNMVIRKTETSPTVNSVNEGSDLAKMLTDTIQLMRDLLVKGDKQNEILIKNNEHIRQEAELYRKMVMDGYDSGLLQWSKK